MRCGMLSSRAGLWGGGRVRTHRCVLDGVSRQRGPSTTAAPGLMSVKTCSAETSVATSGVFCFWFGHDRLQLCLCACRRYRQRGDCLLSCMSIAGKQ